MEKNAENIVLIGMPGAGKSTVGVVLAKMLGMDFLDTDLAIQNREEQTLQHLIDTLGPSGFMEVENDVLKDVSVRNTIIATGGSAVYSTEGMEHLGENGTIVYLKASLEELRRRISNFDERGIVVREGMGSSLSEILDDRREFYEKYADLVVDIDGTDISEAASMIARMAIPSA